MRFLLLFSLIISGSLFAQDNDSAQKWLEKMLQAASNINYQGVIIYGDSKNWNSLHISHAVIAGQEYEKMLYLTGKPREFIRQGNQLMCIHANTNVTKLNKQLTQNPVAKNFVHGLMHSQKLYHITLQGQERIAGRAAQKISLTPKDPYRYSYQLWLDTHTALMLRSDMLNKNQLLERFQFAQIQIGIDLPKMLFKPETKGQLTTAKIANNPPKDQAKPQNWQMTWLPEGFKRPPMNIDSVSRQEHGEKQMYSDGLSSFSIFIEPTLESMPEMQQQWGATAALVKYKLHNKQLYKITIVGELPILAMQKIADAIHFDK